MCKTISVIGTPPKDTATQKGRAPKKPVPTPKKKAPKLNIMERKFIKLFMNGMTPTEAMREAGYTVNTANAKAGEKLEKVRPIIEGLMDKMGISDERLLETLDRGLDATKQISCNVIINGHLSANEQDAMKPAHEMTKDFVEVEDFAVRHKYLETGLKLRGHLQKQELNIAGQGGTPLMVSINFVKAPDRGELGRG